MKRKTEIMVNCAIVTIVIAIVLCASLGATSTVFGSDKITAIYHGDTSVNNVSLMINVYWGSEYVEPMLAILKKYEVKATFFVGGSWADDNNELLMKVIGDGHEVGNHGYFHKWHSKLSYQQNYDEIYVNHKLVLENCHYEMSLFAPPSGDYNATTLQCADDLGYRTIMWSKDTIDWRDKDSKLIFERATKNIANGDLILMHPTQCTLDALDDILRYYNENNMFATTVSNNLNGVINDFNKTI